MMAITIFLQCPAYVWLTCTLHRTPGRTECLFMLGDIYCGIS